MLSRRTFLQTTAASAAAYAQGQPRRVAIVANAYQPIFDRLLIGYPHGGVWRKPNLKVVSLAIGGQPAGDLSGERAREFGFQIYSSPAEALRSGGRELAVDAVLISGDFLDACVKVFEQDGRAVPVFCDGRVSSSVEKAKSLVDAARRLHFPLMAGSSIPLTWRLPAIDLPLNCGIEAALMVGTGPESASLQALEGLQCMVERRRGGETGVRSVQWTAGDAVWKAGDEGRYPKDLLVAALSRSDTPLGLTDQDGRTQDLVASGELRKLVKAPAACFIEYRDGLKATALILDGAVKDFNFAARLKGTNPIWSVQFLLSPEPNATHSACLMHTIVQMFETGAAAYPVERALLAGGILESGDQSRGRNQARVETPHLSVAYRPPRESQFARS